MRIISKFHDYYDSLQTHDKSDFVYVRKSSVVQRDVPSNRFYAHISNYTEDLSFLRKLNEIRTSMPSMSLTFSPDHLREALDCESLIVGFCGKFYPILRYYVTKEFAKEDRIQKCGPSSVVISEPEDLRKFILRFKDVLKVSSRWLRRFDSIQEDRASHGYRPSRPFNPRGWEEWLQKAERLVPSHEYFVKYDTPIFLIRAAKLKEGERYVPDSRIELVLNPCLQEIDFASIIDPYTAFQELEMYLTGPMAKDIMPPVERTDELIAHAHGFDSFSFRRGPTKGTKRKK